MNSELGRRTQRAMRIAAFGVLGLGMGPCGAPAASESLELARVERSGFTMDMPSWEVQQDSDEGGGGRYAVAQGALRAGVNWSLDGHAEIDVLDTSLEMAGQAIDAELVDRRVEHLPGELRLHGLFQPVPGHWVSMTQIACRESGVLVSVSVSGRPKESVQSLQRRMLTTLLCRSGDLPELTVAWPFTDLPEAFGLQMDGSPVLGHRDGRWAMVGRLSYDPIESMRSDPERVDSTLMAYGQAIGVDWAARAQATEVHNLTDPAWLWRLASPAGGAFAASVFTCEAGRPGYIVFTGDQSGISDSTQLEALTLRFGCPTEGSPSLLDRPTACEVGVHELCGGE